MSFSELLILKLFDAHILTSDVASDVSDVNIVPIMCFVIVKSIN